MNYFVLFLERVVELAWEQETVFNKAIFKKKLKRTDSLCQGISRNVFYKISPLFRDSFRLEFEVKKKRHILVYLNFNKKTYVIDGTVKQFLPREKRNVFLLKDYPFVKELRSQKLEKVFL